MLRSAISITFGFATLLLAVIVSPAHAASSNVSVSNNGEGSTTNVHVQTNTGGNTICQNGKCETTSDSNGKSTVCVNGVCNTSEDGNVNYKSDDGKTTVSINNGEENGDQGVKIKKGVPTITPTLFKEVKGAADTNAEEIKKEVKKKVEEKKEEGFNLLTFLQSEFESIKKLFSLGSFFEK